MDNTEQLIAIYHTGFIVCAVLFVVGILLAVAFFFMFDIRNIFLIRTGRAKQQAIEEMEERNLKTGKLSTAPSKLASGQTGKKKKTGPIGKNNPESTVRSENTTASAGAVSAGQASETSVLQNPQATSPAAPQYNQDPLETVMLSEQDSGAVSVNTSPTFRFTVTERTIIIHTTETI